MKPNHLPMYLALLFLIVTVACGKINDSISGTSVGVRLHALNQKFFAYGDSSVSGSKCSVQVAADSDRKYFSIVGSTTNNSQPDCPVTSNSALTFLCDEQMICHNSNTYGDQKITRTYAATLLTDTDFTLLVKIKDMVSSVETSREYKFATGN